MSRINLGRVITGGLLAGLVLNVGEFVLNEVVFKKQMEEMFSRLRITPPGANFIAIAIAITFLLGIFLVWVYAMIRPRFGAGPKTAVIAGVVGWFGIYLYSGILNGAIFGIPASWLVLGMVWGFVEYALATIAGAWLYKEA
ncbi:MAG: hypothetical protein ABR555_05595 [Pyrinomonadaceae bacterium]